MSTFTSALIAKAYISAISGQHRTPLAASDAQQSFHVHDLYTDTSNAAHITHESGISSFMAADY